MTQYVAGFAFNETESLVAMILKARPAFQKGRFNAIGGKIEEGESPLDAMNREWEEETQGDKVDWTLFAELRGNGFRVCFYRGNTALEHLESASPNETVVMLSPEDLPVNVLSNVHWLLPMARTASQHDWPYVIYEKMEVADERR